jgi:sporulation protein YlmC with PRC-barrel domain
MVGLVELGDTGQIVAQPAEDIRGRTVRASDGNSLGRVDELLIDRSEHRVRMLRVTSGGFLGLGATAFFIPVEAIFKVDDDTVYVTTLRDQVVDAPRYDPELADISEHYDRIYRHYGFTPYWGLGRAGPLPKTFS